MGRRATSHPGKDEEESETPGDAFDFEEGLHGKKSKRLITDQVVRATYNVSPQERRRRERDARRCELEVEEKAAVVAESLAARQGGLGNFPKSDSVPAKSESLKVL